MIYALLGSNILMIIVFLWRLGNLPPQIPLFYTRPWGEGQLADTWMILALPLLLNFFFFFNRFVAKKYFMDNVLVQNLIYYLNILLMIGFTLIFIKIIFLVS